MSLWPRCPSEGPGPRLLHESPLQSQRRVRAPLPPPTPVLPAGPCQGFLCPRASPDRSCSWTRWPWASGPLSAGPTHLARANQPKGGGGGGGPQGKTPPRLPPTHLTRCSVARPLALAEHRLERDGPRSPPSAAPPAGSASAWLQRAPGSSSRGPPRGPLMPSGDSGLRGRLAQRCPRIPPLPAACGYAGTGRWGGGEGRGVHLPEALGSWFQHGPL